MLKKSLPWNGILLLIVFLCVLSGCLDAGGPETVIFTDLNADGGNTATTAKLTLGFSQDITGLNGSDISLTSGDTGAAKGTLTRTGTGVYELALMGISKEGTVGVTVAKSGYDISGGPKIVTVFFYNPGTTNLSITFTRITDAAPVITGPTLYRVSNNGPTSAALTVDNPSQYSSITWWVQDTSVTGSGETFTISAANTTYNFIAEHFVTVMVIKEGVPYNKTVSFKVEY